LGGATGEIKAFRRKFFKALRMKAASMGREFQRTHFAFEAEKQVSNQYYRLLSLPPHGILKCVPAFAQYVGIRKHNFLTSCTPESSLA